MHNPAITNFLERLRAAHILFFIMLVSLALRLLLVADGAQRHFPDEHRYYHYTIAFTDRVFEGNILSGFGSMLQYRTHHGAYAATFIPAIVDRIVFELAADEELSWRKYWKDETGDFRFSAIFFTIPSVLSIGLIYLIAKRAGSNCAEALLATFLLATANCWFIWSRHFLTYDISMLFALSALYVALRPGGTDFKGAMATGLLLTCAFWVYTNHVFLVCTIGLLYVLLLANNGRDMIARTLYVSIGASILFVPFLIYNYLVLNINVFAGMLSQVELVTQGIFEEGIVLPFVYFRESEGLISLVWVLGLALAFKRVVNERPDQRRRIVLWLAALFILYGLMSLVSTGLQFVVLYGRTVRALVPFIVLICAYGFAPNVTRYGLGLTSLCVAGISVLALLNFAAVISYQHHMEIAGQVRDKYGQVSLITTFTSPSRSHLFKNAVIKDARYVLVNAGYYYPITEMNDLPEGEVIMKVAHPFMYRPWQYEGMTPEMREIINRDGLYIWLIDRGPLSAE